MRIALAFLVSALGFSAQAQEVAPAGRYDLVPVEGGALRLDTLTGAVSLCGDEGGAVACRPVRQDQSGSGESPPGAVDRLAALEARVAVLEAQNAASGPALSDEEAVDRVADLAEKMMRRLLGIVRELKGEMEGEQL